MSTTCKVTAEFSYGIGARTARRTVSAEWQEDASLGSPHERIKSLADELLTVVRKNASSEVELSDIRSEGSPS